MGKKKMQDEERVVHEGGDGEVKRVRRERGEMGKGGGRWAREEGDGKDEDAR